MQASYKFSKIVQEGVAIPAVRQGRVQDAMMEQGLLARRMVVADGGSGFYDEADCSKTLLVAFLDSISND